MLRRCCLAAILLGMLGSAVAAESAAALASLPQRLQAARAQLVAANAKQPPHPDQQAAAVERLFDLLDEGGQLETDEAKQIVDRDLELHRADAPNGSTDYALTLDRQARLFSARSKLADVEATSRRALSMLQQQTPEDSVAEAYPRITLGLVLLQRTKLDEGLALLQTAIADFDAHRVINLRLIYALRGRALAHALAGEFDLAQADTDRAVALATQLTGADSGVVGEVIASGSYTQRMRGDVAGSIALLDRAMPLLRDAKPPRQGTYTNALVALGQVLQQIGDCHRAEQVFGEGIALEEPHPSRGGMVLPALLNGIASCVRQDGRFAEAAAYHERAVAQFLKLYGADSPYTTNAQQSLATDYMALHRYEETKALLEEVLDVASRAPESQRGYYEDVVLQLGMLDLWQGQHAEAEKKFRSYLARSGNLHLFGLGDPRDAMAGVAVSLFAQGRNQEAFAEAVAVEQSRQQFVRTAGADLSEHSTISMHDKIRSGQEWVLAIAAKTKRADQAREAWSLELQFRGLATTMSARRLAVARAASDSSLSAVWNEWKRRDEALVKARVDAAHDPSEKTDVAIDAAEVEFDKAERALARASGTSGKLLGQAHQGLTDVLDALPAETVLVSYAEGDASEPADLDRAPADLHPRLYAFAATRGKAPQLIELGPRPAAESAVRAWLDLVIDRTAESQARTRAGQRVRELIWDPIAKRWPQKRVLVVPSAVVERVPFAALPEDDARYLVEVGYAFHLLDHERDLLIPATKLHANATLSLIGAPDFSVDTHVAENGVRGVCAGLRGATFTALPQSAREIDELRALWSKQQGAIAPTVLVGADATEARARSTLHGSRIVHFATHGIFLGDQCQAAADTRGIKSVDTARKPEQIQELSALVLSGANRPATNTEDDGLLTSEEIAALDLTGTDWAVLSACDTGIGKHVSGEGVFGLRRAFRLAGANSVVMSLWPVSDAASADWMLALYRERLQHHATTIDAVGAADLALIKQRRDMGLDPAPYYWAAFVAAGDWH